MSLHLCEIKPNPKFTCENRLRDFRRWQECSAWGKNIKRELCVYFKETNEAQKLKLNLLQPGIQLFNQMELKIIQLKSSLQPLCVLRENGFLQRRPTGPRWKCTWADWLPIWHAERRSYAVHALLCWGDSGRSCSWSYRLRRLLLLYCRCYQAVTTHTSTEKTGKYGSKKRKRKKKPHFKFWHFPCHLALPDRSFGHLPILHPTCGGCERGSRGDRWWQRRCGGGGSRHGDDRSCGGRAERPDSDLLRLGGIFATMGTEKHASAICSAAPAAQHRHTPPVETVSYALVWAALKKCALKEEHKAEE